MLRNRPIVTITIGYIIGIILGLYCKISIVLFYLIIYPMLLIIIKIPNIQITLKKINISSIKKIFIIVIIASIIANTITLYKNKQYYKISNDLNGKEIVLVGTILSNGKNNTYKVKIKHTAYKSIKGEYVYLKTKEKLEFGDIVEIKGIFNKPKGATNYGGFDYSKYLKTLKICGTINAENIAKQNSFNLENSVLKQLNLKFLQFKNLFQENFDEDVSNVLVGIVLGYTDEIDEETKQDFSNSNISHIIAVSGMHIGYIILFCGIFRVLNGKKNGNIITICFLILYNLIIGFHASAIRSTIMAVLMILAKLIHRKSDVWTNISLSLLILLIYNPFLIQNTGLILSYVGTIGIIIYSKKFKIKNKISSLVGITISVALAIIPFMAIFFNKIPILSLFISVFIGVIVAPIIILGFVFLILGQINPLSKILKFILTQIVKILLKIAEFGGKMPFNKLNVITPNIIIVICYYILIFALIYKKNFLRKIPKRKIISLVLIFLIFFSIIKTIPKNLRIYFIDVEQGDSCLILTPKNKSILIDGGGSENYDVGKNTLLPYLFDRGIDKIDYIMPSHMDTDHVRSVYFM